jgi:selenocysteine-specific elongation factor
VTSVVQTQPIILGTAGHIDHGKTALVRALTGIDTDRLKEEKERGITTELGFAHLDVGGRRFGLIDVPGHERFLRAMVAGAGGVDVVMLVIAADEGVMPQTREHLDVCQLLGIRHGVIVLTKRDLVDAAWLELVESDVRAAVAGTFLAEARLVPVSAKTGEGLDALRDELARLATLVRARPADGPLRLPLDRVFTMKGFGTVVTGTIVGGRLRVGDDVTMLPQGAAAKVRGLQVHGVATDEARAGMRCAVNLAGVERAEVRRGETLVHPGTLAPAHLVDARLAYLRTTRAPLPQRAKCLVHLGTAQVLATVVLADRDELAPGDEALVQLHLDEPLAALPGDRFIARGFQLQQHHGTTIGGGEIVRVHARKLRRADAEAARTLEQLAAAAPAERVALEIRAAGPAGMTRATLGGRLGLAPGAVDQALNRLVQASELLREGDHFLHAEALARVEASALAAVDAFHAAQPHKDGMPREELRSRLPRALAPRLFDAVVAGLARRGALVATNDLVARARRAASATAAASALGPLTEKLAARFAAWALEPPRPEEVAAAVVEPPAPVKQALDVLLRSGKLVRVKPDYFVDAAALATLRAQLAAHLAQHAQITPQEWKAMVGSSRKFAIPLAEYFDAEKLTLRVGEIRKLRG